MAQSEKQRDNEDAIFIIFGAAILLALFLIGAMWQLAIMPAPDLAAAPMRGIACSGPPLSLGRPANGTSRALGVKLTQAAFNPRFG